MFSSKLLHFGGSECMLCRFEAECCLFVFLNALLWYLFLKSIDVHERCYDMFLHIHVFYCIWIFFILLLINVFWRLWQCQCYRLSSSTCWRLIFCAQSSAYFTSPKRICVESRIRIMNVQHWSAKSNYR